MSDKGRNNDVLSKDVKRGVIVFSNDEELANNASEILDEYALKNGVGQFLVIRQDEVSELGNTATISLLDVDFAGAAVNEVLACITKIKGESSRYPVFLLADESRIADLMKVQGIRQSIKHVITKPLNSERLVAAFASLNDAAESGQTAQYSNFVIDTADASANKKQSLWSLFFLLAVLIGAASYWLYAQKNAPQIVAPDLVAVESTVFDIQEARQASSNKLFSNSALPLLKQARAALKKGYIVGPENVNALHYYRLVLDIDPYSTNAQARKKAVFDELKSALELAVQQRKQGRSNSILKVMTELDPFNPELESLRASAKSF